MLAPLVLLLVLPGAEPNEAEKLFRQMETKLAKAKTVDCAYEARVEADEAVTMKGTLLLGEGNKFRWEVNFESGGMKEKFTWVGDGAKMTVILNGDAKPPEDVDKEGGVFWRAAVARTTMISFFWDHWWADDEYLQLSAFKLRKKEMIDKQEVQVVQYTLTLKKAKEEKVEVSVWIDTKTQLPLKRVLTGSMPGSMLGKKMTITETYTKFEIDGKIDPKQFELPKE
jgi:outer membrane lipoprotein-sorting protein